MCAVTKRALVIGLGKQMDKSWGIIHGDKDATLTTQMLGEAGFTDIRTLVNEEATKKAIVKAFLGLALRCEPGDIVYIHYSGHGQLMTDLDGDEANRWEGRHAQFDESWIPYDAYMIYGTNDKGEKHLCDDEVAYYLSRIRQCIGQRGKMYVAIDACHSGDASRGGEDEITRGVDTEFVIPMNSNIKKRKSVKEDWLTISACQPYQLCFEHKEKKVGKLTYALYLLGPKIFSMSNDALQQTLVSYMEKHPARLPQNPMVTGKR